MVGDSRGFFWDEDRNKSTRWGMPTALAVVFGYGRRDLVAGSTQDSADIVKSDPVVVTVAEHVRVFRHKKTSLVGGKEKIGKLI
ncbi:hypothetical protein A2899_03605 [Candidatus Amesbacteria bacterium RIFCSPLOWO2_01_FULL_49_25]|nr:MAG: hypothetical protein A2899_03605 [Candidatus Amesbacteria bacterium RIFCSPLOWO2_01_FULL_49_25]